MAESPLPSTGGSAARDVGRGRGRITPMWLAHHYPEDYGRCVLVGRSHVCRRCLVLYPLAFAVTLLASAIDRSAGAAVIDALVLVLLPIPAVVELVAEQLGVTEHRPIRQVAVTVPLAVGLGWGFAVYLADHTSALFWGVVVVYTGVCGVAVLVHHRR